MGYISRKVALKKNGSLRKGYRFVKGGKILKAKKKAKKTSRRSKKGRGLREDLKKVNLKPLGYWDRYAPALSDGGQYPYINPTN